MNWINAKGLGSTKWKNFSQINLTPSTFTIPSWLIPVTHVIKSILKFHHHYTFYKTQTLYFYAKIAVFYIQQLLLSMLLLLNNRMCYSIHVLRSSNMFIIFMTFDAFVCWFWFFFSFQILNYIFPIIWNNNNNNRKLRVNDLK